MIDWAHLTRDVLAALPHSIDRDSRLRIAWAEAERIAGIADRELTWELLKELPGWSDQARRDRARWALQNPTSREMILSVAGLKALEIADEIEAMTGHERIRLRRYLREPSSRYSAPASDTSDSGKTSS